VLAGRGLIQRSATRTSRSSAISSTR